VQDDAPHIRIRFLQEDLQARRIQIPERAYGFPFAKVRPTKQLDHNLGNPVGRQVLSNNYFHVSLDFFVEESGKELVSPEQQAKEFFQHRAKGRK
jgi:hypothetical protein